MFAQDLPSGIWWCNLPSSTKSFCGRRVPRSGRIWACWGSVWTHLSAHGRKPISFLAWNIWGGTGTSTYQLNGFRHFPVPWRSSTGWNRVQTRGALKIAGVARMSCAVVQGFCTKLTIYHQNWFRFPCPHITIYALSIFTVWFWPFPSNPQI